MLKQLVAWYDLHIWKYFSCLFKVTYACIEYNIYNCSIISY